MKTCSPCEFEEEVRKSAIDIDEWERNRRGHSRAECVTIRRVQQESLQ